MKSLERVFLGVFVTDGNIVVTDPCYNLSSKSLKKIKVKPGIYKAYVTYGRLKDPFCAWDKVPGNFRVAELCIEHASHKDLKYSKRKSYIDVDSGQAGFFNIKDFKKDSPVEISLLGERYSFFKESATTAFLDVKRARDALKGKDKSDWYTRAKEGLKSDEKTQQFFEWEIKARLSTLKDRRKELRADEFPSWYELKKSKDFYDIVCSFTSGKHEADVSHWGAASKTGEGDGCYGFAVAKTSSNKIIGCRLEFIAKKDFK